jgi:subfamily B ATP-binding cassette protein MsbA
MENFKRLLRYLRPYRFRVALAVGLMFLVTLSAIPLPLLQKQVIDVAIPQRDRQMLAWVFVGVVGLYLGRGWVSYSLNALIGWLGQRVIFDLRFQSYRHLQRLSLAYYDGRQPGKIMARLTSDIDVIQYALTQGFVNFITDLATVVIVIGWLLYLEWRLALIALAILPLYVLNYKLLLGKIRSVSVDLRERRERMIGAITEKLAAVSVVKAFVREQHETDQFMQTVRDNFDLGMTQTKLNRFLGATSQVLRMVGTGLLLWYVGRLVLGRNLSAGELLAFYGYVGYLYDPAVRSWTSTCRCSGRWPPWTVSFEDLDTQPEIVTRPTPVALPTVRGDVAFLKVTFG